MKTKIFLWLKCPNFSICVLTINLFNATMRLSKKREFNMREADSMLIDLVKSRNELLDYQKNIEQQLLQAEKTIIIAQKQDVSEDQQRPITEQDAVWHNYLLKIFIDIKNNLRIIDSAIKQCEENAKGAVSLQEEEMLEPARY